ncbi:substrate-binding domain-containing protein [Ideonella sp. YS5]|uniref:substrate-binding domain-containing protein n=1 Tax=Ideonella sp. YS5 TaxID=3453714 RepID=UPI003EEA8BCF
MSRLRRTLVLSAALLPSLAALPVRAQRTWRIVIIPKLVGIAYYDAVKTGIDAAAKELPDVAVTWTGPAQDQVERQIELIERLIPTRPDLIAVAANDPVEIAPVIEKAQKAGIHVISWDGDTNRREFFVNLVDFEAFGSQLVEAVAKEIGPKGDIAIVTTSFTAPNQTSWIDAMKRTIYAKYPGLRIVDVRPAGESTEEAHRIAQDYLASLPSLKAIVALGAPNLPGVARAVRDAGRVGKIAVVGNSTPNQMREFLKDGTVRSVLLWNAPDHGYLTVYSARQLLLGGMKAGQPFKAGTLGSFTPRQDATSLQVTLPVLVFTKDNVDQFRF